LPILDNDMNAPIRLLYTEDNLQDVDLTLAHFEHAAADFSIAVVRTGAESLARPVAVG
jgi:hypothetical protein